MRLSGYVLGFAIHLFLVNKTLGQTCVAGLYPDGGTCTVCPINFYCPDGVLKLPCPTNAQAPSQSTSVAACECQDDFAYESISYSCVKQRYVFDYKGSVDEFVVPTNVNEINFKLWGAGGGGGGSTSNYVEGGGAGGFSIGKMPATPGNYLYLVVGGGGRGARLGGGGGGWPNGGPSNFPWSHVGSKSGSGGGRSQISVFTSKQTDFNNIIRIPQNIAVIAGAGGGSGWTSGSWNEGEPAGRGGGGLVGSQHPSGLNIAGGQTALPAGTKCPWDADNGCVMGSFLQAGNGREMTGAGGDGYYGGSGGARNKCVDCACGCANNGGGAGGSSYFNPTFATGLTFTGQNGFPHDERFPANASDPDNNFQAGRGGARYTAGNSIDYGDCGTNCSGQNGKVVLRMNGPSFSAMGSCKPGTYSPDPLKTWECLSCPAGEFCLGGSHHQICTMCPDGEYMSAICTNEKDKVCTLCPVQHYCKNDSKTVCPDYSNTSVGSSIVNQCSDCLIGHVKTGPMSCRPCTAGFACPNMTSSEIECPVRYFATTASTACTLCQPGNYCPNTTISLSCDGLKNYSQPGSYQCNEKRCLANTYSWNATCVNCPSYISAGVSSPLSLSKLNCSTKFFCAPVLGKCACDLSYSCGPTLNQRCTLVGQGIYNSKEYTMIDGDVQNGPSFMWGNSFIQMTLNGPTKVLGIVMSEHPGSPGSGYYQSLWVGNDTATPGCTSLSECIKSSVQCTISEWGNGNVLRNSGNICDNTKVCRFYVCDAVGTYVTIFGSGGVTELTPYGESLMSLPCKECTIPSILQGYKCSPCISGFYPNQYDSCVVCPSNFFCNGSHQFNCSTSCPVGKYIWKHCSTTTDIVCACNPGTYLIGGNCTLCPVNSFCPGDDKKYDCPGSTPLSAVNSSSTSNCYMNCPIGYGQNTSDLSILQTKRCGANQNTYCPTSMSSQYDIYGVSRPSSVGNDGDYSKFIWTYDTIDPNPWWRVDMEQPRSVGFYRLSVAANVGGYNYKIWAGNNSNYALNSECGAADVTQAPTNVNRQITVVACRGFYRYVTVTAGGHLAFTELEMFGPSCMLCPPGTFSENNVCKNCPTGTYNSIAGSSTCMSCPPDSSSPVASISIKSCTCFSTFFRLSDTECSQSCPVGKYSNNSVTCDANVTCQAGWHSSINARNCSLLCTAGSQCPGNGSIIACSLGTYSNPGAANCTLCESGFFCLDPSNKLVCPPNSWSSIGSTFCDLPCPVDKICPGNGKQECSVCKSNEYIVKPCFDYGDIVCNSTSCLMGQYLAGNMTCANCSTGTHMNVYGIQAQCIPCSQGFFANQTGSSSCTLCPLGTITTTTSGFVNCVQVRSSTPSPQL